MASKPYGLSSVCGEAPAQGFKLPKKASAGIRTQTQNFSMYKSTRVASPSRNYCLSSPAAVVLILQQQTLPKHYCSTVATISKEARTEDRSRGGREAFDSFALRCSLFREERFKLRIQQPIFLIARFVPTSGGFKTNNSYCCVQKNKEKGGVPQSLF